MRAVLARARQQICVIRQCRNRRHHYSLPNASRDWWKWTNFLLQKNKYFSLGNYCTLQITSKTLKAFSDFERRCICATASTQHVSSNSNTFSKEEAMSNFYLIAFVFFALVCLRQLKSKKHVNNLHRRLTSQPHVDTIPFEQARATE